MINKYIITIFFILSSIILFSQEWKNYPYYQEGTVINFPSDEGFHPNENIEWWYTTAHLIGQETGNEYTIMLTYFAYDTLIFDGFRILNIANETTGDFYNDMQLCNFTTLSENHLYIVANLIPSFTTETWVTSYDTIGNYFPFEYDLNASSPEGSIDFHYNTVKRPLILGDTGFFNQGINSSTYYYSQTGIDVTGTLSVGDITESVTGLAWIDRQYGSFNPLSGEGYEWFSLQMSNGMDINFWNIFDVDNEVPDTSTYRLLSAYVDEDTSFSTADFNLERLGYTYTADNGRCYASKWNLTSDEYDIDVIITAINPNSEVVLPFYFFEGGTIIEGTVNGVDITGVGFTELLHTYEVPEFEIISPNESWNSDMDIDWSLTNYDEGRPVQYDIDISYDDKVTYHKIAQNLDSTSFLWDSSDYPQDGQYWFRIIGYSVDSTLVGAKETTASYPLSTPIFETEINSNFDVYPNPAKNYVLISFSDRTNKNFEIKVINSLGEVIDRRRIDNTSSESILNLENILPGNYFIQLESKEINKTKPIIISK